MINYEKRFFTLLEQDAERKAMEDTLEKGTNPEDFDAETQPGNDTDSLIMQAAKIKTAQSQAMTSQLGSWVEECDRFLDFLNGTGTDSIQSILANAEPDTIFDRMKQSEQRKIARVATELAALTESFRGYISQSENPTFKYV